MSLLRKFLAVTGCVVLVLVGLSFWAASNTPDARAEREARTIANATHRWNEDFKNHLKVLPSLFPGSLEDLKQFGYIPDSVSGEFFPPSIDAGPHTTVVRTFTTYVYFGHLDGSVSSAQK